MPASDVTADVEFRNEGMHIHATSANVGGLRVTQATADIPDLKQTHLRIKAAARGDLQDGLAFLNAQPARARARRALRALERPRPDRRRGRSGSAASTSRRSQDRGARRRFADATVAMRDVDAPVRSLEGKSDRAQHAGRRCGPACAMARRAARSRHPAGRGHRVHVECDGHCSGRAAQAVPAVGGQGQRRDRVAPRDRAPQRCGQQPRASPACASNRTCEAWASRCPSRWARARANSGRSRSRWRPTATTPCSRAAGSATCARSCASRGQATGWSLDRGGIRADGNAPALPNHRGLRIEGAVERFVLDDWLALKGDDAASGAGDDGKTLSDYLQAANVRVGTFEFAGYRWSDVRGVLQATTAGWRVDVDGPGAAGQILIPEQFSGSQALRATLERLVLEKPESSGAGDDEDTSDPRNIPNLQVHVGDLRVGTRDARYVRPASDPRAAGHPLRERLDPRRLCARRRAGRLARHARRASAPRSRRRSRATTSPRRCAR